MHNIALQFICATFASRYGIHPASTESALLATLDQIHAESHDPTVARSGLTPDQYRRESIRTPRFTAMVTAAALWAEGREADSRLAWEAYVQQEASDAEHAHRAVPPTALLGNPEEIHRVGRRVGLSDDQTDQLIPGIVRTLATGYPHRAPNLRHLSLTGVLAEVTADDLTLLLRHAALVADGRRDEATAMLRRIQRAAR
ncbi:hypothetical protein [Streptomyces sp. NPDC127084]|uniref:hypothetical protein n=1 Tax=Streptomyces sp. NPDC127084 TaxID=3347133 RepID=UPI0036636A89